LTSVVRLKKKTTPADLVSAVSGLGVTADFQPLPA
jgi:hypothetical protein